MKYRLTFFLISIILILATCCIQCSGHRCNGYVDSAGMMAHPAVAMAAHYEDVVDTHMFVVPYFMYIMGIHSLQNGEHQKEVRNLIRWVFDHLDDDDRWGVAGSINDYVVLADGTEIDTRQYDSADGYAGQFLMLCHQYYEVTGDDRLIRNHENDIRLVADVILQLQDKDGLAIAMPSYPVKYLMDNCEAYGGLKAFVKLADKMGWAQTDKYRRAKTRMKKGIMKQLYIPEKKIFYYAMDRNGKYGSAWSRYYPDAFAQLFPLLYDVVPGKSELGMELWKRFHIHQNVEPDDDVERRLLYAMLKRKLGED